MKTFVGRAIAGLCVAGALSLATTTAGAQMPEVKEKPRMYTYVSNWTIPRAKWGEMEKDNAANTKMLDHDLASGAIVGYGDDTNLVHTSDGSTHDSWWSAMSMAALINVLEEFYKTGSSVAPVLTTATKHWDGVYVSRFYNWHGGSYKDTYTHVSSYKLKADAPNDAVEVLSKNLVVPLLEKLLADGTLVEYEIDEEAIHTESPDMFWIEYIAANSAGLDKVNAALREALKAAPLAGPAFGSMVDFAPHRDYLSRTNATYK
ncbi:MAG: hypothetical protein ACLPTM_05780 [Steroidobacteraceae bacterium]